VTDFRRDVERVVVEPLEIGLLQVLRDLALAELVLAAGLGDVRQMRELRQLVAEPLHDENLPRRVRQVLDRADHVRDSEVVVVDGARKVIETRAVGALHDVVLLVGPIERDVAANEVVEAALTFARHLEPHDALAALGLEALGVGGRRREPSAAVEERALVFLCSRPLGLNLLGRRVVAVRVARLEQASHGRAVRGAALRLEVRRVRPADVGAFVPVEPEPPEPVENRRERGLDVALLVRVVDAQQELTAALPRE
jgi:hypothetical protein